MTVEHDDEQMYLRAGVFHTDSGGDRDARRKLTYEGAAEVYWAMLIQPLQPR